MFYYWFFKGISFDRLGFCKDVWRCGWVSNYEVLKNLVNIYLE